ncbi:DUF4200 domain-containing protein [Pontibacter sp. KCTC 32443]|uniref:DUF4200 domain-containing protein n=1 Tax=Pontibacter TaxID=323449 RepID=UPI00164D6C1F|nr:MULTISPECIES: DUF4200 domain-containing protein [Pontibacter]MBC5772760.1 DUF4200 domain-containing protein [Pontibacter sp. KCTC 32443]
MKTKADPTTPVATRINTCIEEQLRKGAASLNMSMSQYIGYLLTITLYGSDVHELQEKLIELTQQLEVMQAQLEQEKAAIWKQEPYASFLQKVLHNDSILATLYTTYITRPVPVRMLIDQSFYPGVFLNGVKEEDKVFHFTGTYGWSYADAKKSHVTITNRK